MTSPRFWNRRGVGAPPPAPHPRRLYHPVGDVFPVLRAASCRPYKDKNKRPLSWPLVKYYWIVKVFAAAS